MCVLLSESVRRMPASKSAPQSERKTKEDRHPNATCKYPLGTGPNMGERATAAAMIESDDVRLTPE